MFVLYGSFVLGKGLPHKKETGRDMIDTVFGSVNDDNFLTLWDYASRARDGCTAPIILACTLKNMKYVPR